MVQINRQEKMSTATHIQPSTSLNTRIRRVALPVEHGGWGLMLEPIVLGLVLVPSTGGFWLAVAAVASFLWRQPFKLVIGDRRRRRRLPRTQLAEVFVLVYGGLALLALLGALRAADSRFLLPILIAAPVALVQIVYDALGRSRSLVPELAGTISIGAVAAAEALAGGWPRPAAFALWIIMAARALPTILYLRARLRLLREQTASTRTPIVAHVVALIVVFGLAKVGLAPYLAVLAIALLFVRALVGLSRINRSASAKKLGLRELGFGAMTVLAVILGQAFGW